ncbi:MAG: flagellar motor switch protein FliN [Phycisphaeraceae bacterium]|nr:MAG: flagellar motor switch protein FliN [Phycisphaeraceae bacterium]
MGAAPPGPEGASSAQPVNLPDLMAEQIAELSEQGEGIDLLSDVNLQVKIELGRTRMYVEDVLRLRNGAVVELDKLAGDPVDVYVNDRPVARGEVLILNDNFCVRINEILSSNPKES